MRRVAILAAAALLVLPLAASAAVQVNATADPGPNSAQRRAILDALRPAIVRELRGPVEFVVTTMRVRQGWALVIAQPQRPGGGRIDARRLFPAIDAGMMDGVTVSAILRFRRGRWTRVQHAIGATDVWYCDPAIGAPRALTGC